MYLVTAVVLVLGLLGFADALFKKFFIYEKIEEKLIAISNRFDIKLIFDLAFCQFCQRFWISVVLTLVIGLFLGFGIELAIVPFLVIGIHK